MTDASIVARPAGIALKYRIPTKTMRENVSTGRTKRKQSMTQTELVPPTASWL